MMHLRPWVWSFLERYSLSSYPSAFGSEVAQVVSREMGVGKKHYKGKR